MMSKGCKPPECFGCYGNRSECKTCLVKHDCEEVADEIKEDMEEMSD
jgi:hypothetical protein